MDEVYFAPDNPQTKIAVSALLTLEREGFVTFVDELLWNGPGFDVKSTIRVNKERVAHLRITRWERFKELLGFTS
jgi:cobalamin biosynthesis protein CbiG